MINAILLLAGTSIMFFGYDSSCMSQVDTNADYLRYMGTDSGSARDSAAVGGLVSLWFGGFGIGMDFNRGQDYKAGFLNMLSFDSRCNSRRLSCR